MYSVDCCPKGLVIGKQGENEAEKIAIDFSPWASEFGAGTISARLRRPKDSAAYPVALITEGTTATWTISATDTQYAGAGSLQLVYIVGDVVAKSVIWPVRVLPSLEAGEAPEPYESWLDTLEGLAADTQGNARDAAASAADAAQSATSAAASAQDAAESAASITGLTAVAETLPEGSEASASFDGATDTLTLGIPKGDTGAAGPKGDTGSAGADGFSPSASVTKQDGNITITVTDKDGTTSETLEVDNAIDEDSVNPVQNAAIVEAMRSMLPVDTASGAIASFPDGADDVPMLSLKAQIEPVQDLNGYDSPWPAGGGKNKCNAQNPIVLSAPGNIGEQPCVIPAGTYTFSFTSSNSAAIQLTLWDADAQTIGTFNSPTAYTGRGSLTFTISADAAYLRCYFNVATTVSDIQVESGSTATAYAPYSNICPISGWDAVEAVRTGKNLFPAIDGASYTGSYITMECDGGEYTLTVGNTNLSVNALISNYAVNDLLAGKKVIPAGTYACSIVVSQWGSGDALIPERLRIELTDNVTGETIRIVNGLSATLAHDSTISQIHCDRAYSMHAHTVTKFSVQLEFGSTATDYEPYSGTTYPISWQTEAGTVYGGTLDVVSGVLTVDRAMVAFDGTEGWAKDPDGTSSDGIVCFRAYLQNNNIKKPDGTAITRSYVGKMFADTMPTLKNGYVYQYPMADIAMGVTGYSGASGNYFYINTNKTLLGIQSVADLREWLRENPTQVVYELATPQTYQLTPQEVRTLLGTNNVWSDTGDMSVTYRADIAKYIEKKVNG